MAEIIERNGQRVEMRKSKSSTWLLVWAIGVTGLLFILILVKYIELPLWLVVMLGVGALIALMVWLYKPPELDMYDAWMIVRSKEYRFSKTILPRDVERLECEVLGNYYVLQAVIEHTEGITMASFLFNRLTRGVDARRIRTIDLVTKKMERSKIVTNMVSQTMMRQERNKLLESAGIEPENVEHDEEDGA